MPEYAPESGNAPDAAADTYTIPMENGQTFSLPEGLDQSILDAYAEHAEVQEAFAAAAPEVLDLALPPSVENGTGGTDFADDGIYVEETEIALPPPFTIPRITVPDPTADDGGIGALMEAFPVPPPPDR